jgi:hypothetical protein
MEYVPRATLGFLNWSYRDAQETNPVEKRLEPDEPFPWLTWNNRPYVSGNELMLVPYVRSSQLLSNFTMADNNNLTPYKQPVNLLTATPQYNPLQPVSDNAVAPYVHLENFLYEDDWNPSQFNTQPPRLYRMLELVGTPSLYAGVDTWLNPQYFGGATDLPTDDPRYNRQAPFNAVSTFREPGRINLNTIASRAVYNGIFHAEDNEDVDRTVGNNGIHPGPDWNEEFIPSRRGYEVPPPNPPDPNNDPNGHLLALNPDWPTFFGNPFRAPGSASLVPLQSMIQSDGGDVRDAECTLFRSEDESATQVDEEPLFTATTNNNNDCDAFRNAFFHYAPMTRLENLVTTQSNVYAVWITIGFFEVKEADFERFRTIQQSLPSSPVPFGNAEIEALYRRVYPDGYEFSREAGLDEGEATRLRGFYIIDRSRPAAFEPGIDNNIENVIRLRRRIE